MDRYLGRILKNWAGQQQPPEDARGRLLLIASSHSYPPEESLNYLFEENYLKSIDQYNLHGNELSRAFDMLWVFQLPMPALRMV